MTREEAIEILWRYDVNFEPHPPEEVMHAIDMAIEALEGKDTNVPTKDCISRQAAIDVMWKALYAYEDLTEKQFMEHEELELEDWFQHRIFVQRMHEECMKAVESLPSAEPKTGEWTTEQVAEMLANLFGDECACNWSGIDEWLPLACKYADTQCPDPKEKHGCWMQFLIQGGGTSE